MPDRSIDELVRRYRAGESCAVIAAATGSRPTTVQARLKRAGVKLRPPGRPASRGSDGVTDADLVVRYRAGETVEAIAAATSLSKSVVHDRLKRAEVEMRRGGTPPGYGRLDLPVAEIIERYKGGEPIVAIGRLLGVSHHAIRCQLVEAGAKQRQGTKPSRRAT
jgi:hypothetical protein